jgi:hypothetical protein
MPVSPRYIKQMLQQDFADCSELMRNGYAQAFSVVLVIICAAGIGGGIYGIYNRLSPIEIYSTIFLVALLLFCIEVAFGIYCLIGAREFSRPPSRTISPLRSIRTT